MRSILCAKITRMILNAELASLICSRSAMSYALCTENILDFYGCHARKSSVLLVVSQILAIASTLAWIEGATDSVELPIYSFKVKQCWVVSPHGGCN